MFFKGSTVYVINLLTLLCKNKDIVDVAESSLSINFDQTMMEIYFYSSVSSIIPVTFE